MKIRIPLGNMVSLSAASIKGVLQVMEKLGYRTMNKKTVGSIDRVWFYSTPEYDPATLFDAIKKIAPDAEINDSDYPRSRIIRFKSGNNQFWIGIADTSLMLRQLRGAKGVQQLRNEGGGF